MANKKIGLIVAAKEKRAFILEEGEEGKVYEFSPELVSGNLSAQDREYPMCIEGQKVTFVLDENNVVVSVFTLVFQKAVHDTCIMGAVAGGVRGCVCGNEIRSSYASCSVCALKAGKCAKCGENIS